ncbi:MAG TPA: hypothetical protein VIZ43_07860 [Trebonia sp.]
MTDIEELVREGIDRLTAGADVPAGLLTRARRRNCQRRRAIWAVAVAGTAAVTAAAVIAAASGPGPQTGSLHEQDISYVVSRAQQALAGLTQSNAIEVVHATASQPRDFALTVLNMSASGGTGVQPGVLGSVRADRTVVWNSAGPLLVQGFSADGKLAFAYSIGNVTSRAGKSVQEAYGAAYSARIQWHSPLVGAVAPNPPLTCQNVLGSESEDFKTELAKGLSCHLYTLAGSQEVNGVNTIKLTLKPQPGLSIRQTLWIDPSSYLPVREAYSFAQPHGKTLTLTDNFQWLPRNQSSLAALRAAVKQSAIPSGFRSLPADDLPLATVAPAG